MEDILKEIYFSNTAIELAKNPEFRDLFIDLGSRRDFLDPVIWCNEPHLKGTRWNAKALVMLFETIEKNCPGLIEFQKRNGLMKLIGFPKLRLTFDGIKMASMLSESRAKNNL